MKKTISILSDTAINQIAAGEVVEGPASVVKELVENAVDAGADRISIEIKGGGHFFIEVSDNGKGMEEEDVALSIQRFATSKIKALEDLNTLASMGFRGEALAAISSVSNFSIMSSTGGVATFLQSDGGKNVQITRASRGKGTTICVENLFYNTPARKKFQKARGPSTTEIVKCVTKLSLCHKQVAFTLTVDEREVFSVEGTEKNRVKEVLGKDFFQPEIEVHYEGDGIKIDGVISSPEKHRSNRLGQYLIVNKRNVYSLLISNAVLAGYGTALGKGDFPLFFLDMTFDPSRIDVNVHPQKKEIRFQEEEMVFAAVRDAISSALTGTYTTPVEEVPYRSYSASSSFDTGAFKDFTYVDKKDEMTLSAVERPAVAINPQPYLGEMGRLDVLLLWDELCMVKVFAPHPKFPEIEEKETVLVDLSILEKRMNAKKYSFEGQALLEKEEVFVAKEEVGICERAFDLLEELGFVFKVGDLSIVIDTAPSFTAKNVKEVFLYTLALIDRHLGVEAIKDKILFRILHKKKYTESEARYLLESCEGVNFGSLVTKKDIRGLCKEFVT